ncbi:MAG: DNA polymerase III subunit gamma/tau [Holosporaceae bacterium]|jgi:DNA polymerase-3 subunit gamma/tau|nr:DNA polymerase III subunit gamma/tau [Holosporaceae bacterium]
MSHYVPLATKYRPQKFSQVVGQDISVRILAQGILKNRLGSAMLFAGTRGVGKTTIARILAKALRCAQRNPEPCGKCDSCLGFLLGNQIDVIEIDAASHTGVDDVREIIESCRYGPTTGQFKIFLIDEVHMLSKSAFNALLKTLEEPPEHAKFLMATTEIHKIPETILSRVLRFDLKRVGQDLIAQYLSSICNQENISVDADAVSFMAKAADGSIRDGLSILDQAINLGDENRINLQDVKDLLGFSEDADLIELLQCILSSNVKAAVSKYREIIKGNNNISGEAIINALLDYIHVLSLGKTGVDHGDNILDESVIHRLSKLESQVSLPALSHLWQMLLKALEELNFCDHPGIVLEMAIIRIAHASRLPSMEAIIGDMQKKCNAEDVPRNVDASGDGGAVSLESSAKQPESANGNSGLGSGELVTEVIDLFPGASLL